MAVSPAETGNTPGSFPTNYNLILERVNAVDAAAYGKTRNFIDGSVTRLSPYISRGVISTCMVMKHIQAQGYPWYKIEKFIQELAWRDYWQQIWIVKGDQINHDLKREQTDVEHHQIPRSLLDATTGIKAIDRSIRQYYNDGYLHNHIRMYIASIACNVGKSHWKTPARWMFYHLIDGDWASNALSWQWVAGSNASKKYIANQANINRYCSTKQRGTFMDVSYDILSSMPVPTELREHTALELTTDLPKTEPLGINPNLPLHIYNYYNLDPEWRAAEQSNRVLLLEPTLFQAYPISSNAMRFMLALAENINGIQIYVGEFDQLIKDTGIKTVYYKEHPLNNHYTGTEDARDWMFPVKGYFPSFFGFWKRCKQHLP